MNLPIVTAPAESLRQKSREISIEELKSETTQKLIDAMFPTMHNDDGIGLAAPQVGHNVRIFTVGKDAMHGIKVIEGSLPKGQDVAFVNPTWERTSRKSEWEIEGCLSVPNTYGKVKRFARVKMKALDRYGNKVMLEASGYLARVIQHETDHLNGILFIDRAKDTYTVK